jgi:O-antigen/teichoic acid export membrane protein
MRQVRYIEIRPRPGNLFAQVIGLIVGLGVLIVSVVLGAFLLAAFLGFVLLVAVVLYGRFWWLRRRMMRERRDEFIETEYRVVDDSTRPDRRA